MPGEGACGLGGFGAWGKKRDGLFIGGNGKMRNKKAIVLS